MASKRPSDDISAVVCTETKKTRVAHPAAVVTKDIDDAILADTLPEDVVLKVWNIGDSTTMTLTLDRVFGGVFVKFVRTLKTGVHAITLAGKEFARLQTHAKSILTLSQRYAGTGRNVTFSFQLAPLLKANLDLGGFGYLDIRHYFLARDDKVCPTRVGVRFPQDDLSAFCETVEDANKFVQTLERQTGDIVRKSKVTLMCREIAALAEAEGTKPTTQTLRRSNLEYSTRSPSWLEAVDKYISVAESVVLHADVVALAEKVGCELGLHLLDPESHICEDPADKLLLKDQNSLMTDSVCVLCVRLSAGDVN